MSTESAALTEIDLHYSGDCDVLWHGTTVCVCVCVCVYVSMSGTVVTLSVACSFFAVMPYLLWAVDSALIRQAGAVWWLVMYLGQATKDYLGWARPPSPPVVRLETDYLAEYSMPSTHAMAGTAIPVILSQLVLERYQVGPFTHLHFLPPL